MPRKNKGRGRGQPPAEAAVETPRPGRGRGQPPAEADVEAPRPGGQQQEPTRQLQPPPQATQAPVRTQPQAVQPPQQAAQPVRQPAQPPPQAAQPPQQPAQPPQQPRAADQHGGARPRVAAAPPVISGSVSSGRQVAQLQTRTGHDFPLPQTGTLGRRIQLFANHYKVDLPRGSVFHYDVDIRPVKKEKNGAPQKESTVPRVGVPKPEGIGRRLNPRLCREVIEMMLNKYNLKRTHWPAFDGNKNLYTRKPLPITTITQFDVTLVKVPGDPLSEEKFQVTVKPVEKEGTNDCEVSLEPLFQMGQGRAMTYPEETVLALDIIMRYGPSLKFVPVGRSFFMKPRSTEEVVMEEGRSIWFGYHQSLRPGWKPLPKGFSTTFYLNIDKAATAFLRPINLVQFCLEVLHCSDRPPSTLSIKQIGDLNKKVKTIQVKALHLSYPRKYRIVKILKEAAHSQTFDMNGKRITVENYFKQQYSRSLKWGSYPCVQVGDPNKHVYLPMEVLEVVDDQPSPGKLTPLQAADMVKYTAVPPKQRFEEIDRYVKLTKDNNMEFLKEFEINISSDPVQFSGRVLPPPAVEYKSGKAPVRDGQWEMRGKTFISAQTIQKWVIFTLCRAHPNDMIIFADKLVVSGRDSGMNISKPCDPPGDFSRVQSGGVGAVLAQYKNKFPDLELAVVVLPKSSHLYKEVKHEGETKYGLITQCVTDDNMRKCKNDKFSFRFLMNICQKINAKLGGTNVSLQKTDKPFIFDKPVIVIGADVTHPPPGATEAYSIAACVGSIDGYPARYVTKVRLQRVNNEVRAREERILCLDQMVKELLKAFYGATKHKPERIVFFRDGVSEGQFLQVRNFEIHLIRKACSDLQADYQPKISFIIVQKRHHTRFCPQNFKDGLDRYNYNIPAGTTVDTDINHPSYFNFFLASHVALQGTTRPAHYTVLWDDNDFTADVLQKFVFYLCHTYNRCTRSISIPPPVAYADLAAYRAKLYIDDELEKMSNETSRSDASSDSYIDKIQRAIETTENVKNNMYFC